MLKIKEVQEIVYRKIGVLSKKVNFPPKDFPPDDFNGKPLVIKKDGIVRRIKTHIEITNLEKERKALVQELETAKNNKTSLIKDINIEASNAYFKDFNIETKRFQEKLAINKDAKSAKDALQEYNKIVDTLDAARRIKIEEASSAALKKITQEYTEKIRILEEKIQALKIKKA